MAGIAARDAAIMGVSRSDCRGASISGVFACRAGRRSFRCLAALDSGPASVAFHVELEDRGVMDEPVDGGERHGGVGEDPVPLAEGLVGGDRHRAAFVAGADQLEEDAGLGLILGDAGPDSEGGRRGSAGDTCRAWRWRIRGQARAGRPAGAARGRPPRSADRGRFAAGSRRLLARDGAGEEHAPAIFDQAVLRGPRSSTPRPMAAAKWLLPPPGGPNTSRLSALFEPAVAGNPTSTRAP